ncbi:MAG: N-6 DNA methylase [Anaerolineae bacterium]|nr:N-6 DNA methylase [Anaerolineae bacterium]
MSAIPNATWQEEFGIDSSSKPNFFSHKSEVDSRDTSVSYVHIVRRAFDILKLDAVWCDQNTPLVYFKLVDHIDRQAISDLHRRFWNHGGAAILVIISPNDVEVYSGLARPAIHLDYSTEGSGFVTSLTRASQELREFLPAVESGEFFRRHAKSFDPKQRVDQSLLVNLQATRENLAEIATDPAITEVLDAFLCRLVFVCYLFDRGVIGPTYLETLGLPVLPHLRDILGIRPRSDAKECMYRLFHKLALDFNGDLFSDDLTAEANLLSAEHLDVVEAFFRATDVSTGQQSIWPYDFGVIPIETVSAIYERFLKSSDREQGAFYTPRFLAELVLDVALGDRQSLLGLRFLDPACGSGIFLVGLFNRLAEEWRRENPDAHNDQRASELIKLMRSSIFGVDLNPIACRITAFSLYLAYLDQLTPRDIQDLQQEGNALPRLVARLDQANSSLTEGSIWCGDFFRDDSPYPIDCDVVIGNPPWGSIADENSLAAKWCQRLQLPLPDTQIAVAFTWKAARHVSDTGRVCLLMPHGILFNHNRTSLDFQKAFVEQHSLDLVLNLTDYQSFLFSKARHPALVLSYRKQKPAKTHSVDYWTPKADWKVIKAEIITISEHDRAKLGIQTIRRDLDEEDAPQIWKQVAWATPRDRKLLDRLADMPRLRNYVRQAGEKAPNKPWLIAQGFQPFGQKDPQSSRREIKLPTNLFVSARSKHLNLFLLPEDCQQLSSNIVVTRRKIRDTKIFEAPHVLVAKGFGSIAFVDFSVAFRHALRGISGPSEDKNTLAFLAAYMRSSLAQYFLFHTSSNWGVSRNEVLDKELLRLPFPLPVKSANPERAIQIIEEVAQLVVAAAKSAGDFWNNRLELVTSTQHKIEPLIFEYFDILPSERVLIHDTINLTIPSFRPSAQRPTIPSIEPSSLENMEQYTTLLSETLNNWARRSNAQVIGSIKRSSAMGTGLVMLEKVPRGGLPSFSDDEDIFIALNQLRDTASVRANTFELMRGVKVFAGNRLYILKPLSCRHWTETAALNDADEIAASILMQPLGEHT